MVYYKYKIWQYMENHEECKGEMPIMLYAFKDLKCKGSITVEATIIVPVVILSITAVIYIGLLLYQRTSLQAAADKTAAEGAAAWTSGVGEIGTGKVSGSSFDKRKLYRRIYDSDAEMRLKRIENRAASLIDRGVLIQPTETAVKAEIKDYAVSRKLVVSITQSYRLPLGSFLRLFGGSGYLSINVRGASTLDEPVELIRNTDFILDLEKKLEEKNPTVRNLGEKARNAMNDIKSRLEKFLN